MSTPAPLETFYKGYRFRSRLEARWAVFFDALDIRWEYEPEAFDLGGVGYLPDFCLSVDTSEVYAEVKRPNAPESAFAKAVELSGTGRHVVLLSGPPEQQVYPFLAGNLSVDSFSPDTLRLSFEKGFLFRFNRGRSTADAVAAARSARFEQNRTAAESLHG